MTGSQDHPLPHHLPEKHPHLNPAKEKTLLMMTLLSMVRVVSFIVSTAEEIRCVFDDI